MRVERHKTPRPTSHNRNGCGIPEPRTPRAEIAHDTLKPPAPRAPIAHGTAEAPGQRAQIADGSPEPPAPRARIARDTPEPPPPRKRNACSPRSLHFLAIETVMPKQDVRGRLPSSLLTGIKPRGLLP